MTTKLPIKPEVKTQAVGKPMPIVKYIDTINKLYGSSNVDELGNEERFNDKILQRDKYEKKSKPKGSDFYYNASENALELKSSPSPLRPTPQAAKKKDADKKLIKWALEESPIPIVKNPILKRVIAADNDPAAGAKYIDWWDRIETKNRT